MPIKLQPGDLAACDAAMRLEKAQEDLALIYLENGSTITTFPSEPLKGVRNEVFNMNDNQIEQEIQAKGLTAPRVTLADIEGCIVCEWYISGGQIPRITTMVLGSAYQDADKASIASLSCLTLCVLVLKNGFTVTGESACASPENFDAALGRKIARQKAVDKIWELEGYRLKQALADGFGQGL